MINLAFAVIFSVLSISSFVLRATARGLIFLLIAFSAIAAVLVGRKTELTDFSDLVYLGYLIIFLFLFVYFATFWLKGYQKEKIINDFPGLPFVGLILVFCLLPLLLLNIYIFSNSISLVLIDAIIDIDEYKNEGGVDDLLRARVGSLALLLTRIFSPLGFICIPLAVLAWIRDDNKLGLLLLLCSFNWVLLGLMSFSRSALVGYILVVTMMLVSFWSYFTNATKSSIVRAILPPLLAAIGLFGYVTISRFSDPENWVFLQAEGSLITNPALFAIFDYFGQWIHHSFILISSSELVMLFHGHHVSSLLHQVGVPFISERISWYEYRVEVLGDFSAYFVGLPYIFYIDFGILGLLILFCFASLISLLSLRSGKLRALYFILTPFLLLVACMFFADSHFAYSSVQQAGYYTLVLFIFLKVRFSAS